MNPCPICGKEMTHSVDRMGSILCEEFKECPEGHFYYLFSYGVTQVKVGIELFEWSWNSSPGFVESLEDEIDKAIKERTTK